VDISLINIVISISTEISEISFDFDLESSLFNDYNDKKGAIYKLISKIVDFNGIPSQPVFAYDSQIRHTVFNNFITPAIDMVATRDCVRTMTELITFFRRSSCCTLHVFQAIWNTETSDICYSCFAQSRLDILSVCLI